MCPLQLVWCNPLLSLPSCVAAFKLEWHEQVVRSSSYCCMRQHLQKTGDVRAHGKDVKKAALMSFHHQQKCRVTVERTNTKQGEIRLQSQLAQRSTLPLMDPACPGQKGLVKMKPLLLFKQGKVTKQLFLSPPALLQQHVYLKAHRLSFCTAPLLCMPASSKHCISECELQPAIIMNSQDNTTGERTRKFRARIQKLSSGRWKDL